MINTPIDNFVFKAFTTKTIDLDVALKDLDDSLHALYVDFAGNDRYLLLVENRRVRDVIKLNNVLELGGARSLALVGFRLQREQSRLTLGKLSKPLEFFYNLMVKCHPSLEMLDTNYFSFWRFVSTLKEKNTYGLCSLCNESNTLWAIFEAGELSGGWLCRQATDEPTSLSIDRVLEEAVRIAGMASFYDYRNRIIFDVINETIFYKKHAFQRLMKPDSPSRFIMKREFGEMGSVIAAQFDGRKTVAEVAQEMRIPFEQAKEIAKCLYELDILGRN